MRVRPGVLPLLMVLAGCAGLDDADSISSGPASAAGQAPALRDRPPPPCADLFDAEAGMVQRFAYRGPLGDTKMLERTIEWTNAGGAVGSGRQPWRRLGIPWVEPTGWAARLSEGLPWSAAVDVTAATDALASLNDVVQCGQPREPLEGKGRRVLIRWQEPWVSGVMYPVTGPPGGELELREDPAGWMLRSGEEGPGYIVSGDVDAALDALLAVAGPQAAAAVAAPSIECPPDWAVDARVVRVKIDGNLDIEATRVGDRFEASWTAHRLCCIPSPMLWQAELGPAATLIDAGPAQELLAALGRNRSCHDALPELPMSHAPYPRKVEVELEDGTLIEASVALNGARISSGGRAGVQWTGEASVAMGELIRAAQDAGPPQGRLWRITEGSRLELQESGVSSDPAPDLQDWDKRLGRELGDARYCLAEYSRTQQGSLHETYAVAFTVVDGVAREVAFQAPTEAVRTCVVEGVTKGDFAPWADGARIRLVWQLDVFTEADGAVLDN